MPLVSVVIPVYNRLDLLKETLDSVFSQIFFDFEVFVIDDGSTESLDSIVQEYGARVTFIRLLHSGLPSVARNCGIKKATGQYIAFLDADDTWLPEKLKTQVQVFFNNPDIAFVCSDAYVLKASTQAKPDVLYLKDRFEKTGLLLEDLITNNFVITSTCMVRREVLLKTGGFSEDRSFRGIEDYELWLRIARQYPMQYIPIPLAVYRDEEVSLRSEISRLRYYDGIDRIYSLLLSELPSTNQYTTIHKRLAGKIYENKVAKLCMFLETGDKAQFRSQFKDLIVANPFMIPNMCASVSRMYMRQMKAGLVKNRRRFE